MNLMFMRHGNAEPIVHGGDPVEADLARPLTEVGRKQIPANRFGRNTGRCDVDLWNVFSSTAIRAIDTARIASGVEPKSIVPLSVHKWDGAWEGVQKLLVDGGDRSLNEAYKTASREEIKAVADISNDAFSEIQKYVTPGNNVLIVGHAMFLQALAIVFAEKYSIADARWRATVHKMVLGEAEYFGFHVPTLT